jgi:hypothetical protein
MELNIPGHIYSRFYVNLLKQAEDDLFSSQIRDDTQLPPLFVNGEPEYTIEKIKKARLKKVGKGNRREILVKWKGNMGTKEEVSRNRSVSPVRTQVRYRG